MPGMQVFNGPQILAEEHRQAEDMFQALHETRLAASSQPLNQLVSGPTGYTWILHDCRPAALFFMYACMLLLSLNAETAHAG